MQCYVPFCKSTRENISTSDGISYHGVPTDRHLRAAWLGALGMLDSPLPDCAVVCSLHFLNEDLYRTESGSVQVGADAIPAAVQFCMICLATDSKMLSMKKHKLLRAYTNLTGYTMCEAEIFRQTLCVECAHRLDNFSRFRDKSLRACSVMKDIISKDKVVSIDDMNMINRTNSYFKSNIEKTILEPDYFDLYICEAEDEQAPAVKEEHTDEHTIHDNEQHDQDDTESLQNYEQLNPELQDSMSTVSETATVKEETDDFTVHDEGFTRPHLDVTDENMYNKDYGDVDYVLNDDISNQTTTVETMPVNEAVTQTQLYQEATVEEQSALTQDFKCEDEFEYHANPDVDSGHITTHTEPRCGGGVSSTRGPPASSPSPPGARSPGSGRGFSLVTEHNSTCRRQRVSSGQQSGLAVSEYVSDNTTSQCEVPTTETLQPVAKKAKVNNPDVSQTEQSETACLNSDSNVQCESSSASYRFTCDVCEKTFKQKGSLVRHMRIHTDKQLTCNVSKYKCKSKSEFVSHMGVHTGEKPFACNLCEYKCANKSHLAIHMRVHTGEKPFACELCEYKCARKSSLASHMKLHTGNKPFAGEQRKSKQFYCKLCAYKCKGKKPLVAHMRVHTGKKPFACELCEYKCANKSYLVIHMRVHTGEKPFSCDLCEHKCAQKIHLVRHLKVHAGEKPFACELCEYKCASKSYLAIHMRVHTGEKPFACELCDYKCIRKSCLRIHMKGHTGEKPFSCKLCKYKCAQKCHLEKHMGRHTGEKPFACRLCEYKCARKGYLATHMRVHTGEKPYTCELCEFKFGHKSSLASHMKLHTGDKPFAGEQRKSKQFYCKLCAYKCKGKKPLVAHMRVHTGKKPFACELCEYKCASKSYLAIHMRVHTGEKPFACELCDYKCIRKSCLRIHMKGHTGEKPLSC